MIQARLRLEAGFGAGLAKAALVFATLSYALITLPAQAQDNDSPRAEELKRHVVAIYDQDGKLLGAGASVSATGLVITAKHILEQRISGSRGRNYHMTVDIRARRDTETRSARLVATHPHMDIAILNAPEGNLIQPLLLGSPEPGTNPDWYAIGHPRGINASTQKYFETQSGDWSSVEVKGGLFVLPQGFDTGMSGGPLIMGDRIVGVVSHAADKTYIAPVSEALAFFDLLGFPTSETGFMNQEDHIGQLAGKVQRYERILSDIQIDRRWTCQLETAWDDGPARLPSLLRLKVENDKRLASQPDMNARLEMSFSAGVSTPGNTTHSVNGEADVEWASDQNSDIAFDNILDNLNYRLRKMLLPVATTQLRHLDIRIRVSHISGPGFIKQDPGEYVVCCRLPRHRPNGTPGDFDAPVEARICTAEPDIVAGNQTDDVTD